ncbi:hypothetical protein EDF19_1439 [Curtobacterium sp. PhB115]|nr:hypothetical protein EDF19_1439 [Curtobacterium sp. PhB115]
MPRFGWTRVAMALRPMWDAPSEVLRVEIAGHRPLIIDVATDAYWSDTALDALPIEPDELRVGRESRDAESAVSDGPGNELQAFLWYVGLNSFPGELAWWLQRDDRYRLQRWPNFTTLAHTPDHVRMTSLLGYASLTVDELAEQANVAPTEARRLINAFSLMRILRSETPDVAMARPAFDRPVHVATAAAPAPRSGLFRRLLDRLAR